MMNEESPGMPMDPQRDAPPPVPADTVSGDRPGPVNDTSKLLAAIGYIFAIVAIVVLFLEPYKGEKFVRFHAFQAIGLWVASAIISIVSSFIAVIPFIGWLIALAGVLICLGIFVYAIILAIKAWGGEYTEIPVVYGFVEQYI